MTPEYRPDIDGLRAVAVLAVLLYHSGFEITSGGFVGVDVFFVISGFLITTIILRELTAGNFSLVSFYERRMRRILPAIMTTVAVCLFVGWFVLDTRDLENLARSSIANNLFLANIYFYWQTGYFDGPAELKPLLHTWSLSLEEQYYLVMPVLLILIGKFGRRKFLPCVVPISIASFFTCVWITGINPSGAFYLLPTRAWELLLGSILAIAVVPRIANENAMQMLAVVGLLLVISSVVGFDNQTAFPGAYAAMPTIGTAILIYTGRMGTTLVNRALTVKPLVFVGLISYSLYLWHWPIIVYSRYLNVAELNLQETALQFAGIFAAATLSWQFIEKPFRKKQLITTTTAMITSSLVLTSGLLLTGVIMLSSFADHDLERWTACEDVAERIADNRSLCTVGDDVAVPNFLLWGDSHARALNAAVDASARRMGAAGFIASRSACPPLEGIDRTEKAGCSEFNDNLLMYIRQNAQIDTVILAARWALSAEGTRYKDEGGKAVKLVDHFADSAQNSEGAILLEKGLLRTTRALLQAGKRVVVVGPIPEIGHDVPSAEHVARMMNRDVNAMIAPSREEFEFRNQNVRAIFYRLESALGVVVVWPSDLLCEGDICRVALEDGTALYRDDHHLSKAGAEYISNIFDASYQPEK